MVRTIVCGVTALACLMLVAADKQPLAKAPTSHVLRSRDELGPGVAVVPAAEDRGIEGHIRAFDAAMKVEQPKYPANMALNLIAAGPRLDAPDEVTIGTLAREGNALTLAISYTSARVRGTQLLRNYQWTPLAFEILPHGLPAGKYTLKVTWQCSDKPAEGEEKPADLVQTTKFALTKPE